MNRANSHNGQDHNECTINYSDTGIINLSVRITGITAGCMQAVDCTYRSMIA